MDKFITTIIRDRIINCIYAVIDRLFHRDIVLIKSYGHDIYANKNDIGIAQPLIRGGIFDEKETEVINSIIKPGMIVLDVGANIGYFTLIAAKLTGKTGKVYAFEPQPDNFRLLTRNVRVNHYTNIIPYNMAMSDRDGNLCLFVDKVNYGAHSVSENNLIEKRGKVEVKSTTMDEFFRTIPGGRIDFIKTDTQGSEGLIFECADHVLMQPGLKMIIEFWPWGLRSVGSDPAKLLKKLESYGFSIKVIDEKSRSLRDFESDRLIKDCMDEDNGWGYYNLLLEKTGI